MIEIIVYILCVGLLIAAGLYEKKVIKSSVEKIDLRINVNGIRGKSTATRFITAILKEAGYRVVGKTTGTSARMIVWNQEDEIPIKRRPVGPNIGEQVSVLRKSAQMGADALVCECMAVNPEYQEVYQHQIVQANIVVITNVVEDHLDEMGPTTDQIAWAFAKTIPYDGILVITEGKYSNYFRKKAAERNTRVICIDPNIIEHSYLEQFPYILFPNNCALGLGIAEALGIDTEVAKQAMLKANPDPGVTQIVRVKSEESACWLVNAFAANEPTSSLEIWEEIQEDYHYPSENAVLILCCRDDRVDRSHQFAVDFLPYVKMKTMILIGTGTMEVLHAYQRGKYPNIEECIDLTGQHADVIIKEVQERMCKNVVFCAGNIHGIAENFLAEFADITI